MEKPEKSNFEDLKKLLLASSRSEALQLLHILVSKLYGRVDSAFVTEVREASAHYDDFRGEYTLMESQVIALIEKLTHLSPERQAEVDDFIEFLRQRDQAQLLGKDYAQASEAAFAKVWENDDDALYDKL